MKGQNLKAKTPKEYIAALDDDRRDEIARIDRFIRETLPKKGFEPVICMGMLGYGPFHYKYASGREGDSCKVGLASNKSYISMYVLGCAGQEYVVERYKKQLPKASIGKCCVRFKKFDDLDPKAVRAMLKEAAKCTAAGESSGK
jgi:hypothetical protein